MDVLVAGLVVAVVSFVSGGFAIPIGFALGLAPLEVYIAACAGSVVGLVVFLFAGDKIRERTMGDPETGESSRPNTRIRRIGDRYGAMGSGSSGRSFPA